MRLLALDQFSDLGGAQQVLLDLLPAMRTRGWEAVVALPGHGKLFEHLTRLGFVAERIPCGPYATGRKRVRDVLRLAVDAPRLARYVRQFEGDLIYVNGPRLLPGVALARPRLPVVFHSHSYVFPGGGRQLAREALRSLDARVLANCDFVAEVWRGSVAGDRVRIVYNGVAGPEQAAAPARRDGFAVGAIGRIAPEKGQCEFVAAARRILERLPDCRFPIYGAALFGDQEAARYEAEVRAAAEGLPVEFCGWVRDAGAALRTMDLLLVPSAPHEATTRVILEAFAAGVPVIAFRGGGIPEVVEHGRTGLLADGVEEMAELAVELLTGDPERLAAMKVCGRETWRRRFTLERFQRQLLDALEEAARA